MSAQKNEPTMLKRAEKLIDELYEENDRLKENNQWLREQHEQLCGLLQSYHRLVEQGFHLAFPEDQQRWETEMRDLQQRAEKLLTGK